MRRARVVPTGTPHHPPRLPAVGAAVLALAAAVASSCGAQRASAPSGEDAYYVSGDELAAPGPAASDHGSSDPGRARRTAPPVLVRRAPRCTGTYDCDAAGFEVFRHAEQLRACYEAAGAEAAGRGVVYTLLDVQPEGDVHGVLIGYSDVRGAAFADCLGRELEAVSMPTSPSPSVVQALLVFGARDQAEGRRMLAAYRAARAASERDEPAPMTAVRQSVQGCHERAFRSRESEVGRIVLRLTTHADGRVASVQVVEDTFDGRLDACVVDMVGKLRLALEDGTGTTFVYPVVLQPGSTTSRTPGTAVPH